MIDIILNILFVILIIIGVLIGLLLAALAVILFVPIRYKSEGSYNEKFNCTFSVTWILKLFQLVGGYNDEEGLTWKIKLFYRDYKTQDDLKSFLSETEDETKTTKTSEAEKTEIEEKPPAVEKSPIEEKPPAEEKSPAIEEKKEETVKEVKEVSKKKQTSIPEKPKKKKLKDKINDLKAKIKEFKLKAIDILEKIKYVLVRIEDFIEFAKQEKVKKEFKTIGRIILKVLNHIKPKVLKGRLLLGLGEPDKTGMVIGFLCILYGIYGEDFIVTGDFENKIVEGEYFVKGHFNLFYFIVAFVRILCQWRLITYLFKLIKTEFLDKQ